MPLGKENLISVIRDYYQERGIPIDADGIFYRNSEGFEVATYTSPEGRSFLAEHNFLDSGKTEVYELNHSL